MAVGLLGDLVGHEARELHAATGLVLERGRLGVWLVGRGRRAARARPAAGGSHCYCVRRDDPELPAATASPTCCSRCAATSAGFATVANLAFSGARWRVRRRLHPTLRPALDAAARSARGLDRRAMR